MWYEPGRMPTTPLGFNDPRAREGELLTPRQFSEAKLAPVVVKLGSYGVAGQMQQRPAPKGGALFKRGWFRRYELANGDAIVRQGKPGVVPLAGCSVFVIVDGAASSKSTADHTVIAAFAVTPDGDLVVLHVDRERLEVEQIIPRVQDVCLAWRPDWVGIESNGFQIWFVKEARDKSRFPAIPTVRELDPEGKGKAARAAPAVIRAEQGQIYLPDPKDPRNPWVGGFEEECYSFTGKEGRPDDRVDCLCYGVLSIDRFSLGPSEDELPIAFGGRGELPVYRDRRRGGIDGW
jgi:predicted phage terminase large subunit-like protein